MSFITITGATGQLGGLVVQGLLKRGLHPGEIRASVRDVAKAGELQVRGVDVRRGDFDDPQALTKAFADTDVLMIISTDRIGARVEQHRRAVEAAVKAGVNRIVYTSVVSMQGGEGASPIAADHRATEQIIREAGVPYTFLRNSFYAEYMLAPVIQGLAMGVFVTSAGEAKLGAAARTDMAEAAAVVVSTEGHENQTYEITYPRVWDYREAVDVVRRVSGRPLEFRNVADEELVQILRGAGLPESSVQMAVGMNRMQREGDLSKTSGDLERLLGRPVTSLEELARRMLAEQAARPR